MTELHNDEVEMCLLGALILSESMADKLIPIIEPEYFYKPFHQSIFEAMRNVWSSGKVVELVTLKYELITLKKLAAIGGEDYLIQLAEKVPSAALANDYVQILQDLTERRKMVTFGDKVKELAHDLASDAPLKTAEGLMFNLASKAFSTEGLVHAKRIATEYMDAVDAMIQNEKSDLGISSGYVDLDRYLGGLYPGKLYIALALPMVGKSVLACNVAWRVAKQKIGPVCVFTMEMQRDEYVRRIIGAITEQSTSSLRRADRFDRDTYQKVADACEAIFETNMFICDNSDMTCGTVLSQVQGIRRDYGEPALVVVDYLQLMHDPSPRCQQNRTLEISMIAQGLKRLSKKLGCPVFALAQANQKRVLERKSKRVQLSDARESGSIEAEADVIFGIYRENALLPIDEQDTDPNRVEVMELDIIKNRDGQNGITIPLAFKPSCQLLENLAR